MLYKKLYGLDVAIICSTLIVMGVIYYVAGFTTTRHVINGLSGNAIGCMRIKIIHIYVYQRLILTSLKFEVL